MGAPNLAFHKHCAILPSHFVPARPLEAEAESSEVRDWRSEASPILCKTPLANGQRNNEGPMNSAISLVDVEMAVEKVALEQIPDLRAAQEVLPANV